jgi:hypothetical protein
MPRRTALVLLVLLPLLLAACGGDETSAGETISKQRIAEIERETATLPGLENVGPGLGEAGAPPSLTVGWATDFRRHSVPLTEFQSGGPGKDGIPAIDKPSFERTPEVDFLKPDEPVIAGVVDDDARAYPIQILIWHEIVNDTIGGVPVAVTFCPLCNTSIVFDRRVVGGTLAFGTTGNLRHSDLVMYDRQTESWWQQFGGEGLVGRWTGERLKRVPSRVIAWQQFRRAHRDGKVLSRETGFNRPYGNNPYPGYDDVDTPPFFPTKNGSDRRLPPKERVVFFEHGGEGVAIAYSLLRKKRELVVTVGGRAFTVSWKPGVRSSLDESDVASGRDVGTAEVRSGRKLVPFEEPFWFAVAAFRPDVRVIR